MLILACKETKDFDEMKVNFMNASKMFQSMDISNKVSKINDNNTMDMILSLYLNMAKHYMAEGALEEAENTCNYAQDWAKRSDDIISVSLMVANKIQFGKKEYNASKCACDKVLCLQPDNEEAVCILGDILMINVERMQKALKLYKSLLIQFPNKYLVLFRFISLRRRIQNYEEVGTELFNPLDDTVCRSGLIIMEIESVTIKK